MFLAELSRASEVLAPIKVRTKAASWCTVLTLMRSTARFRSNAISSLDLGLSYIQGLCVQTSDPSSYAACMACATLSFSTSQF